jgi:predicted DsbA family dithiol-disulfide isomerase
MVLEIWSDVACPWCAVGRARLDRALAAFEHRDDVEVVWRSFELDPGAPPERPGPYRDLLARKYGRTAEEAQAMLDDMTAMAAAEGLTFDFASARGGSTFDAHRLVHLAAAHGLQDAMKRRLLRAHFGEGELLSDHATLARLAGEVGLDPEEAAAVLASDRFAAEVRADEEQAAEFGISGVPFFVADRRFAATGAQDPDVLLGMLQRAHEATLVAE